MHEKQREYLDGLKEKAKQYFSEYGMRVIYFRKGYVPFPKDVQISKEQREAFFSCLNQWFGNPPDLTGFELSERELNVLLQEWKYKNSPPKGLVLAFKSPNKPSWQVGWSMCHDGDNWNRYVGIQRAIKSAVNAKDYDVENIEVPHSVRPHLKRILSRID